MRLTRTRVAQGTCRPRLYLSSLCSRCALLVVAGCGATAAGMPPVPTPSSTIASLLPPSKTCPAMRAAGATPSTPLPTIPAGFHLSYVRVAIGPLPLQLIYPAGVTLHFTWCALPDRSQVTARPVPETLTAGFIGPFSTRTAALAGQLPSSSGPLVASTIPIQTTTWNDTDASAAVTLPGTITAGFYIYFAEDVVAASACAASTASGCIDGGRMSGIVQITSS